MSVNAVVEIVNGRRDAAVNVTVLDVSESGLKLESSREIAIGTVLHVWFEALLVSGRVRYCHQTRTGQFESWMQMSDVNPVINRAPARRRIVHATAKA